LRGIEGFRARTDGAHPDFHFDAEFLRAGANFLQVRFVQAADESDLGEVDYLRPLFSSVVEIFEWRVIRGANAEEVDSEFDGWHGGLRQGGCAGTCEERSTR